MEKEYKISWLKVLGIVVLIAVVIVIICLFYPKKDNTVLTQQTYINNITLMKDAGFEYFSGSNLPKEVGDSKRITLDEMLARNLVLEFYDEEGNSCNTTNSYIEATKVMDDEYEMSIYLSCNNKSDYIVTSISNVVCTDCNVVTNGNNSSTNSGTVNQNSSNNSSSNNSSSSEGVSSNKVVRPTYNNTNSNSNSSLSRPSTITQITNVNINYVNTCCTNGNSSNCNDNCLSNIYYSVIFDSNGGTSVRTQTVKHGSRATYKSTSRSGYEFLGWYLNGEKYDFATPVTSKITLVAKWEKISAPSEDKEIYVVDFDSNGGSHVYPQMIEEGDLVVRPSNPTRSCYDFVGWYLDASLTKKYDFATPVTSDMTLYAKWVENDSCKSTYTVKFNSNGGTSVKNQYVLEGNTASKPSNPTKSCYDFAGWYLDASLTKKYDFSNPVTSDITLYAKWVDNGTCKETYQVKFNSNGGTSVRTQVVDEGSRAVEPSNPTRSGYTFLGWYLNGRKFSFSTRIYEDITLVAKWEKEEVKYNTYCKIENKTYYSISYVSANQDTWNYSWLVRFYDLDNVKNLKVTDVGHLTTLSMYNKAYNVSYDKGIIMVNGTGEYNVAVTSGSMLRTYSLKSSNFTPTVGVPYKSSGEWYTKLSVRVKNYNNLTSYYASNIKSNIYFVPFYFDVEYTNLDNCVTDKSSNSYKYDNYEIIDSYYR